ncbi:TIGR03088 family PEP-CTERM/XrtA system glycosyltransferase [Thioalkalivibrio halophilus]|uniref:Sugar transferase n=1 Tax=Thioalkalivibrio halophilus TaxID=252474 RepID=A0A1V3A279_9GAMM|nr:TIGR03088 family PEP-CTERM/XrtA system glycosyltransferase [Thioalkalivibrio halophilus]OOC11436.1 sugar transferase [Thioalkalivibrio halophilus]
MTETTPAPALARDGRDTRPLVAHIVYRLDVGGLENILIELVRNLPRDAFRHVIICIADYTDFSARLPEGVEIYALHKRPGIGPGMFLRLWRLLYQLRPDIVHSSNLAALECQPTVTLAGVPARVHAEHGWDMADLDGSNPKYRRLRQWLSPWVHRHVTVSAHLADYLTTTAGIPRTRVQHIVNGVDTRRFRPHDHTQRSPDAPLVIGTVGRLSPVKDQATLVAAFAGLRERLPEHFPRLRLVLLGDGPEAARLREQVAALGIEEQTWMPGNRTDMPEQLRAMDLFVLPSLAEGIPVTVLEAMASGLPVVASRVGGLPELVEDGRTGTLLEPGDPDALCSTLADYVRDPGRLQLEGARARERAESTFGLGRMVTAYAELYRSLLPAARRPRHPSAGGA